MGPLCLFSADRLALMKWALACLVLCAAPAFAGDETVVAEIGSSTRATGGSTAVLVITRGELEMAARCTPNHRMLLESGADKKTLRASLEKHLELLVDEAILLLEADRLG